MTDMRNLRSKMSCLVKERSDEWGCLLDNGLKLALVQKKKQHLSKGGRNELELATTRIGF